MTACNLQDIRVYPIKSSAGISVSSSWVDDIGLPFDRRFVVSDQRGQFITARTHSALCLVQCNITATGLIITAPDMPILVIDYLQCTDRYQEVTIWGDSISAQRCNEQVDAWFSAYLNKACFLLYFGEHSKRKVSKTNNPLAFADGYPLLLIARSSLDYLNSQLNHPVSMRQFRPNLIVQDCEPFAEDRWQHIRIGDVEFELSKPCSRCIFTTVDPDTAIKHPQQEPLATLKAFRQVEGGDVMFGQNLIPLNKGQIKRGDKLTVINTGQTPLFNVSPSFKPKDKPLSPSPHHSSTTKQRCLDELPQTCHSTIDNTHGVITDGLSLKKIEILFDSWDKHINGNNQETILEQGENAGLILPYSCRGGMCGRCKVKLESGEVTQRAEDGLSQHEKEQGYILSCSSIPKTDVIVSRG